MLQEAEIIEPSYSVAASKALDKFRQFVAETTGIKDLLSEPGSICHWRPECEDKWRLRPPG